MRALQFWTTVFALLVSAIPSTGLAVKGRQLVQREVEINDDNVNEVPMLRMAKEVPLMMTFSQPLRGPIMLAEHEGNFAVQQQHDGVLIMALREPNPKAVVTLTATVEDGTMVVFSIGPDANATDVRVHVSVKLRRKATMDSPIVLKAINEELRAELDACQSISGDDGIRKVAALALQQDQGRPLAFTVERRDVRKIDKQSRLLVEVTALYRLFEHSYVVLSVKNRDPNRVWIMERPELEGRGKSGTFPLKVVTYSTEKPQLGPDEVEKIVIAYKTPEDALGDKLTIRLREKQGERHITLANLQL